MFLTYVHPMHKLLSPCEVVVAPADSEGGVSHPQPQKRCHSWGTVNVFSTIFFPLPHRKGFSFFECEGVANIERVLLHVC